MAAIGEMKMIKLVEITQQQLTDGSVKELEGRNFPLWANVKNVDGRVNYKNGQVQLMEGFQFYTYIHFNFTPDSRWKVLYRGNWHQVKSIERFQERNFNWIINASTAHV